MISADNVFSPEVQRFQKDKEEGFEYKKPRQDQWTENYTLYRDTVIYNRFTQRQSVNIPLMKMSLRTLLAQYDDMPVVSMENLDNDKEKEVFQNEYWKKTGEDNKFEILDIVDKKQEQFFGRTFDQMQVMDGTIKVSIISPEDIIISRLADPTNIHSSRYLIHTHIFVPLSVLAQNQDYDKAALNSLKDFFSTDEGLVKAAENEQSWQKKQQKLIDLGITDALSPIMGETMVELSLYFRWDVSRDGEGQEIYLSVIGQDSYEIMKKKALELHIGEPTEDNFWQKHYPYNSWAGDIDMQHFWTDGAADIVRGSNKVLNTFYSQKVENRTLRNYGMHYYNGAVDGTDSWAPQTFEAKPWGWYKIPGNPDEIVKKVDIPDLGDILNEMKFIMEVNEKATGATSTQQGVQTERKITLGEVELALGQAQERVKGTSKFYTQVWKERATMFLKLIEAAGDKLDPVKIYKKGRNTDRIYEREIEPKNLLAKYRVKIWSKADKDTQDQASLQKWDAVNRVMIDNPKVQELYRRKLLEFADAPPDEINAIMEFEKQKQEMMAAGMMGQGMQPGEAAPPISQQGGIGAQFIQPGQQAQTGGGAND